AGPASSQIFGCSNGSGSITNVTATQAMYDLFACFAGNETTALEFADVPGVVSSGCFPACATINGQQTPFAFYSPQWSSLYGWTASGLLRWSTGYPFSISSGFGWATNFELESSAVLVGKRPELGTFTVTQSTGNSGPNVFKNPGITNSSDPNAAINQFRQAFPGESG